MALPAELQGLDPFALLDAESLRLERFFAGLDAGAWERPTRCEGWRVRDLLAHLAGGEEYNHACLAGDPQAFVAPLLEQGLQGLDEMNDWMVRQREDLPVAQVLDEWRAASAETRAGLRALGVDGTLETMVGPYPAGLQAFHLAMEAATHADDAGVPVAGDEEPDRTAWRARVVRWGLRHEHEPPVEVAAGDGVNRLELDGQTLSLSDAELVEAAVARLPGDHELPAAAREQLRTFA